jgi:hypothetical protein
MLESWTQTDTIALIICLCGVFVVLVGIFTDAGILVFLGFIIFIGGCVYGAAPLWGEEQQPTIYQCTPVEGGYECERQS